jgi:hypothetical protein
VHAPLTQAWLVQAAGALHTPLALHVSTPLFEHCVVPGVHDPVHAPPTQAWLVHPTGGLQAPLVLHVSTPLPEHCVAPGMQAAHVPPTHNDVIPAQVTGLPQ